MEWSSAINAREELSVHSVSEASVLAHAKRPQWRIWGLMTLRHPMDEGIKSSAEFHRALRWLSDPFHWRPYGK